MTFCKIHCKLLLNRYLPIGGLKDFNQVSIKLAYGDIAQAIGDSRVAAVQSLSGTGSCRLMAEFMKRWMPGSKVSAAFRSCTHWKESQSCRQTVRHCMMQPILESTLYDSQPCIPALLLACQQESKGCLIVN